jgi:hypothetical protein
VTEIPGDPFSSPEADEAMTGLYDYYVAAIKAGFIEDRAFALVHDLFITQMGVVLASALRARLKEG